MPRKMILSADDFGISQLANKNILLLIEAKKIQRVSIMINGVFNHSELQRLKNSALPLDLHLAVEGDLQKRHLLKKGVLLRSLLFSLQLLSQKMRPRNIYRQWEEQVERFHSIFDRYPDGLNSHRHIHFFPPYFDLALKLAKEKNIPFIRFGKQKPLHFPKSVCYLLSFFWKKNRSSFLLSKMHSSDQIASLDWIKNIPDFLQKPPKGNLEIICHPEKKDDWKKINSYF